MRNLALSLIAILLMGFASCNKDNDTAPVNQITGQPYFTKNGDEIAMRMTTQHLLEYPLHIVVDIQLKKGDDVINTKVEGTIRTGYFYVDLYTDLRGESIKDYEVSFPNTRYDYSGPHNIKFTTEYKPVTVL
jgi:hypothetical protein